MIVGWWIGNVIGIAVIVPLLVWLAARLIRTTREISRYGRDISDHSERLGHNVSAAAALVDTRDLVEQAAGHAGRYVAALDRRT